MSARPGPRAPQLSPHPWVADAAPYRAGAKAPSGPGSLAQNELPRSSPAVAAAIADAATAVHRYPDPLATDLRAGLAALHAVDPDQILVGGGSDEFLFLLAAAFGGPGATMCCADPPYWGHAQPALMSGADVIKIPLDEYRHDLAAMANVDAQIVFVCNPHNPTGTYVSAEQISEFRSTANAPLVVVDEAYLEFTDNPEELTAIPLVQHGGIAVLRTFSKYYGLAGARIGYMIASPELIALLRAIRSPFSVSHLAQAAALAALDDTDFHAEMLQMIRRNRATTARLFNDAGFSSVPSQTNFILVLCPGLEQQLIDVLLRSGIATRPGTNLGISGTIRVTIPDDDGLLMLEIALKEHALLIDYESDGL